MKRKKDPAVMLLWKPEQRVPVKRRLSSTEEGAKAWSVNLPTDPGLRVRVASLTHWNSLSMRTGVPASLSRPSLNQSRESEAGLPGRSGAIPESAGWLCHTVTSLLDNWTEALQFYRLGSHVCLNIYKFAKYFS